MYNVYNNCEVFHFTTKIIRFSRACFMLGCYCGQSKTEAVCGIGQYIPCLQCRKVREGKVIGEKNIEGKETIRDVDRLKYKGNVDRNRDNGKDR